MIHVRDLRVHYDGVPALDGLSLDVGPGECLLVSGPSGCGKSSLARALSGLIPHAIAAQTAGQVQVAGLDPRARPLPEVAQRVGHVFQNPGSQLFHLRVEDEVAFGPRNLGLDGDEVQKRVAWALSATGLEPLRDRRPATLSGGQKQCVAIAAVLAMCPRVLILDEPAASLDVPNTRRVMSTLRALRDREGMTIVLVEHRLAEAAHLADRLLLLDRGRAVAEGAPLPLLSDRQIRQRLGLRRPAEEAPSRWEALIQPDGRMPATGAPLLSLRGVSAGYGRRAAIEDVDLDVYPGDFLALVGDNGAGKTTLALVAAGLLKPLRGGVRFGANRRPRPGRDVALLFQDPCEQLLTDTVDEEVAFGPRNYGCFDRSLHGRVLEEAGLLGLEGRRPLALSAGQQQRAALAACLSLRPALLILDEPTLGQDWAHLSRLMHYLEDLSREGTAVLLITHDYKLVHHFARRAVLLESGRIALDGHLTPAPPHARAGSPDPAPHARDLSRRSLHSCNPWLAPRPIHETHHP